MMKEQAKSLEVNRVDAPEVNQVMIIEAYRAEKGQLKACIKMMMILGLYQVMILEAYPLN